MATSILKLTDDSSREPWKYAAWDESRQARFSLSWLPASPQCEDVGFGAYLPLPPGLPAGGGRNRAAPERLARAELGGNGRRHTPAAGRDSGAFSARLGPGDGQPSSTGHHPPAKR